MLKYNSFIEPIHRSHRVVHSQPHAVCRRDVDNLRRVIRSPTEGLSVAALAMASRGCDSASAIYLIKRLVLVTHGRLHFQVCTIPAKYKVTRVVIAARGDGEALGTMRTGQSEWWRRSGRVGSHSLMDRRGTAWHMLSARPDSG